MKKVFLSLIIVISLTSSALLADWYIPLDKVPKAVISTAKNTYPDAEIWAVEMESYNVYEVKMSNMMQLYISSTGQLLGQQFDD